MIKIFKKVQRGRHHTLCFGDVGALHMPQKEEEILWVTSKDEWVFNMKIIPTTASPCPSTEVCAQACAAHKGTAGWRTRLGVDGAMEE